MKNRAGPPIKGTVEECLKALVSRAGEESVMDALVNVFGDSASPVTLKRWLRHEDALPFGENLIRLAWFLELVGCELTDRGDSSAELSSLRELIACRLVASQAMAKLVGCSPSHFLAVLHGKYALNPEWATNLLDVYQGDILKQKDAKRQEISEACAKVGLIFKKPEPEAPAALSPNDGVVDILAALILAAIPLAQLVSSDACSPEDRERLREKTGQTGPYNLGVLLQRLCGERAREAQKTQ